MTSLLVTTLTPNAYLHSSDGFGGSSSNGLANRAYTILAYVPDEVILRHFGARMHAFGVIGSPCHLAAIRFAPNVCLASHSSSPSSWHNSTILLGSRATVSGSERNPTLARNPHKQRRLDYPDACFCSKLRTQRPCMLYS